MHLIDVTDIKNRVGEILELKKNEIIAFEDLIIYCESTGAPNAALLLKNNMRKENEEISSLKNIMKTFEQEEARLLSIGPESRYPLVSEHKRTYTIRDHRQRSRY
jgi:bacterioferritin (cytochrome b1)